MVIPWQVLHPPVRGPGAPWYVAEETATSPVARVRRVSPDSAAPSVPADELGDARTLERLREMMLALTRRWFRLRLDDAEDVVQSAFLTYLEVRPRFPVVAEHPAILVGILRRKCLEHIRRSASERRRILRYCATPDAARENPWIHPQRPAQVPSVVDTLVRRDARREIRDSIRRLTPAPRRLVSLIVGRGFRRPELIAHFGVNRNTLDSRLRACRLELRALLAENELAG